LKRCENLFITKLQKPPTLKPLAPATKKKVYESIMQSPLTEKHRRLFIEDVMCHDPKMSDEYNLKVRSTSNTKRKFLDLLPIEIKNNRKSTTIPKRVLSSDYIMSCRE